MKLNSLLLLILFLQTSLSVCQVQNEWAYSIPGNDNERSRSMVIAKDGNLIFGGWYDGEITIGDTTYVAENFSRSGFVVKVNTDGDVIWSKEFHAAAFGEVVIRKVLMDPTGGFYITGSLYNREIDMDPGPEELIVNPTGDDMFVSKYDEDGNYEWMKTYRLTSDSNERIFDMDIDSEGNIYMVGYFDVSDAGDDDNMILLSTDKTGEVRWIYAAEPEGRHDDFKGVKVYKDHVYITGNFEGEADFDPSASGELLYETTDFSAVVIGKLSLEGELVWMKMIEGESFVSAESIEVDAMGNVYVGGYSGGTTDFDPGPGTDDGGLEFEPFEHRPYVVGLDKDGNLKWVWSKNIEIELKHLYIDSNNKILIGGNEGDVFFGALSLDGNEEYFVELNHEEDPSSFNAELKGLVSDGTGSVFMCVDYTKKFQFDPLEAKAIEVSEGVDFAIAKYDVSQLTSLLSHTVNDDISVFPNPTTTDLNISSNNGIIDQIEIYDTYGRLLKQISVGGSRVNLDMPSSWPAGNYVLRINKKEGFSILKINKI